MPKRISRDFYTQPALRVAKELLGKYLIRKIGQRKLVGKIVETEAYIGPKDRASHAFLGKITPRNRTEYLEGGYIYIYLVYGMYWQLNITASKSGKPECVLIRALEPLGEVKPHSTDGPGKLCRWLKLNKSFDGEDLTKSKRIWLEDPVPEQARYGAGRGAERKKPPIVATTRIGIDYALEWAEKPWRFYIKENPFVSRQ